MVTYLDGEAVSFSKDLGRKINEIVPVNILFWNYESDPGRWVLVMGSSAASRGTLDIYRKIAGLIPRNQMFDISDLSILPLNDPMVRAAKMYADSHPEHYWEIPNTRIGDYIFERALIVWADRPKTEREKKAEKERLAKAQETNPS